MPLSFCSFSKENPGSGALGRWQLEREREKKCVEHGSAGWDWKLVGLWVGEGKHTRAVGKPVGLSGWCGVWRLRVGWL